MAYLLDVLLMAKDIRDFTREINKNTFVSDRKTQYAVIRCFEVIGEAVKRLSHDIRKTYPDIPWASMAKMRDLLIHMYDKVDVDKLWDTARNDIPTLITVLERIVPPEEKIYSKKKRQRK